MRKSVKIVSVLSTCVVLALALLLVGCGSSSSTGTSKASSTASTAQASNEFKTNGPKAISPKASEVNSADADGVLTVGFDQEFPPYGYVGNDGTFAGVDLELAAEVAARNGWDLNCVPINWDGKDNELNSGAIDCIWNGFTMEGREDGYAFTEPYMNNTQVVVVKKDSDINSLYDLAGKVVLTQADSAAYNLLTGDGDQVSLASTFGALQTVADYNSAFMELEQGSVDAVAIDQPVANFQISGKGDTYVILSEPLSTEHFAVGFATSNTAERDAVQKTLKEMTADGAAKQIVDKYADQGTNWDAWCLSAN